MNVSSQLQMYLVISTSMNKLPFLALGKISIVLISYLYLSNNQFITWKRHDHSLLLTSYLMNIIASLKLNLQTRCLYVRKRSKHRFLVYLALKILDIIWVECISNLLDLVPLTFQDLIMWSRTITSPMSFT